MLLGFDIPQCIRYSSHQACKTFNKLLIILLYVIYPMFCNL